MSWAIFTKVDWHMIPNMSNVLKDRRPVDALWMTMHHLWIFPPTNTLMTGPAWTAICVIYNLRRGVFFLYHLPIDKILSTVNIESCRELFIDLESANWLSFKNKFPLFSGTVGWNDDGPGFHTLMVSVPGQVETRWWLAPAAAEIPGCLKF